MGTRLTILDENGEILFYGSKLYGYVEKLEESKGLRYLWNTHKESLDAEDFEEFVSLIDFLPRYERVCKLSIEELTEFLRLYDEDLKMWQRDYTVSDAVNIPKDVKFVWLEWG